ncbi:DUF3078 domain-containing protein [Flaviaesturariibacter aridisoli]|uniref:DUF3078 domain-containing protein n=1 Tax=Flaviaesturariibacter aridisoli TaxID=2545761 RepID=A0A4R4E0P9_9BACT|nr:DUF3078 domain-containing protein [Flaviaesturariibacter aridisoli]TCZ72949.1 DUF3078 domain-containing protein [Flaviaesturariibacter aridisoli]
MKKLLVLVPLFIAVTRLIAQDQTVQELKNASSKALVKDATDTIPKTWKKGGLFNFNFGQTSLSNWAAGGDNFQLNVNTFLNLYAFYAKDRKAWDNSLDLAFGLIKTTSLGSRKSDDKIDFTSKYGYELTPTSKWYASALFNFRTQFAPGFTYPDATTSTKISDFLSPGYVLLSLGLDYKPNKNFSLFVSPITSRWVIVTATGLNPLTPTQKGNVYGVPPGKTVNNEIGAYLNASYLKELVTNLTYKGKLELFSNYKHNPQNIDVYLTNLVSANVFKGLSFNLGLDLIYDDDVRIFGENSNGARMQFREFIGIGYLKKF